LVASFPEGISLNMKKRQGFSLDSSGEKGNEFKKFKED